MRAIFATRECGSAAARQHVNAPTRQLTPQQRLDAAARRCNNTAAQYGISSIRHFGNGPLRQCGLRQRRLRSPHPTHSACRTASAPIRHGNSRAAHTHSHIVHTHSRMPHTTWVVRIPIRFHTAWAMRIPIRFHTAWAKPRIHLAARDGDVCLHAAWAEPMPMSENVSMGPYCNDSDFICQKTPEWGPFFLRA